MTESRQYRVHARLAAIWRQGLPQMLDRLAVLERAADAADTNRLNSELRLDATNIAHKLAGSLGMFGFSEGTRLAREIELTLTGDTVRESHLITLTRELRREIAGPGLAPELQRLAG